MAITLYGEGVRGRGEDGEAEIDEYQGIVAEVQCIIMT